jgi:hypothetical protein
MAHRVIPGSKMDLMVTSLFEMSLICACLPSYRPSVLRNRRLGVAASAAVAPTAPLNHAPSAVTASRPAADLMRATLPLPNVSRCSTFSVERSHFRRGKHTGSYAEAQWRKNKVLYYKM